MSAAHKNECPVAAGQVVKTLSKRTTNFIATCAHVAMSELVFWLLALVLLAQSIATLIGRVL